MPQPLPAALEEVRSLVLDPQRLVRAVAAGRQRATRPRWQRVELRPVSLKAGEVLQVSTHDGQRPEVRNVSWDAAGGEVDRLLAEPYRNWHVQTTDQVLQVRVTKRGDAQVHREARQVARQTRHDREKHHLLDPDDPLFNVLGATAAKRRQVDAFLRFVDAAVPRSGDPAGTPLRIVDLGCGNAYLTFAAYRYLTGTRGLTVHVTGVDVRADQRERNNRLAEELGYVDGLRFVEGTIVDAPTPSTGAPDMVLALHACDTATDEALYRAVDWGARVVLAAPCCHHELSRQLRSAPVPDPYRLLTRHGILRERFADVLTDAVRAALLRLEGYRVEVSEFVPSRHTPRNVMLQATHTGAAATPAQLEEYRELVSTWEIRPTLARLLGR